MDFPRTYEPGEGPPQVQALVERLLPLLVAGDHLDDSSRPTPTRRNPGAAAPRTIAMHHLRQPHDPFHDLRGPVREIRPARDEHPARHRPATEIVPVPALRASFIEHLRPEQAASRIEEL